MNEPINKKYGYWETCGIEFSNKYLALLHASKHNSEVWFKYHNDIWTNFDRSQIGKFSLETLYKERALQLRDSYDYLIIYFSGGADSHNILQTFLDNNIKIDEICVKWPKLLRDGKFYSPNTVDTGANNIWSEWNYAIHPTLKWIAANRPDIYINLVDYTENLSIEKVELAFVKCEHSRTAGSCLTDLTVSEPTLQGESKKIGHVFGTDKPLFFKRGKEIRMMFSDYALSSVPGIGVNRNIEYFYWSPNFPILPFEMVNKTVEYYEVVKESMKNIEADTLNRENLRQQAGIVKKMCYSKWDYRFQSSKSLDVSSVKDDRWFWFANFSELNHIYQATLSNAASRINSVSPRFLTKNKEVPEFDLMLTTSFYVRDIRE